MTTRDDDIVLYWNPMSRAGIAHWMCEELGQPYRLELVRFDRGEHKLPAFLAINPMGKLPALRHRGTVVTEAAAICAYLADAYPQAGLAPALDDPRRGTYYRWLFFGAACVESASVDKLFERPPVRTSALGYGTYEDMLRTLESAVQAGPWLLGETFSAADVYVGSQIAWGLMSKGIEARPAFAAYLDRIGTRPAFQRYQSQTTAAIAALQAAPQG